MNLLNIKNVLQHANNSIENIILVTMRLILSKQIQITRHEIVQLIWHVCNRNSFFREKITDMDFDKLGIVTGIKVHKKYCNNSSKPNRNSTCCSHPVKLLLLLVSERRRGIGRKKNRKKNVSQSHMTQSISCL